MEPYSEAEIKEIADRIQEHSEAFSPTRDDLHRMFPPLRKLGYAQVLKCSAKFMIASLIADQNFEVMFTKKHPAQFINRAIVFEVLEEVAGRLSNSFIREAIDAPWITWFSSGKSDFLSDRFNESELLDLIIDGGSNPKGTTPKHTNKLI